MRHSRMSLLTTAFIASGAPLVGAQVTGKQPNSSQAWSCPSLDASPPIYDTTMVDTLPHLRPHQPGPAFPTDLLAQGHGGSVQFTFVIDSTGVPDWKHALILSATDKAFADAALSWLARVRYTPGWREGHRVRVCLTAEMRYGVR